MIRSRLINFLNKYTMVQLILCVLPIILISIYAFAYLSDITNIISVVEYNNKLTKSDMQSGNIKEVSYFNSNEDGSYDVIISDDDSSEETVSFGDVVFEVVAVDSDWLYLLTSSGEQLYITETELFGVEYIENGTLNITVDDNTFEVEQNSIICEVRLSEDGDYEIEYVDDSVPIKTVNSLSTLQVELKDEDSYRIKVTAAYEKKFSEITLNICNNLPTNSVYYNESSQSFVKNITEDFSKTFILSSNILVVIFSMTFYCILISIISRKKELSLLKHNYLLMVDVFAVVLLVLCVPFTLMML